MVTLSDAETTETARQESMRDLAPTLSNEAEPRVGGPHERATMPVPAAAIGSFSIEMNVAAFDIDFKAAFDRSEFREALGAARERLAVSPADTSALRIAQRSEEALVAQLVAALGGPHARVSLLRQPNETEASVREHSLVQRLLAAPLTVSSLLDTLEMGRVETLDLVVALQARGHLLVNLCGEKATHV